MSPPAVRAARLLARSVVALPDRLVLVLFWTSLVVAVTVLTSSFRPALVLPAAAVLVAVTWRLAPRPLESSRSAVVGAALALATVAAWVVLNLPYVASHVIVSRDPGFLTLEGFWLSQHASPVVPIGSARAVEESVALARTAGDAFSGADGELHAQGTKLLPGLLGLAGWLGDRGVLGGNLVLAGLALLAVYGLARRITGPIWALLPVVAMGASLPMLAFSRAAYTEPLTAALVFGGLTMVWSGLGSRSVAQIAVGGAMVGATAMARIDGVAAVIGLVVGLGAVAAAAVAPTPRRALTRGVAAATLAALAAVALGYADLRVHSPQYLLDLMDEYSQLARLLAVVLVVVAVALAVQHRLDPVRRAVLRRRRGLGLLAAAGVVAAAALLASRPLWLVNHHFEAFPADSGYRQVIAGLQAAEDLPVDGTRSYDEMSVTWLSWYFGWPTVVLGFAGLALLVHRAVARRDARALVVAAVIGAPSVLFLWRVSITPDQVWAVRRLLPVTIPGLLIMTTVVLSALWATRHLVARAGALLMAAAVAAFPFTTWGDLATATDHAGRLAEARDVCGALPGDKVVYVGSAPYLATLRVLCDAEVVHFRRPPTAERLAATYEAWGGEPLPIVTFQPDGVPWRDGAAPPPARQMTTTTWEYHLSRIPSDVVERESQLWIGTVHPDGTVTPGTTPAPGTTP